MRCEVVYVDPIVLIRYVFDHGYKRAHWEYRPIKEESAQ